MVLQDFSRFKSGLHLDVVNAGGAKPLPHPEHTGPELDEEFPQITMSLRCVLPSPAKSNFQRPATCKSRLLTFPSSASAEPLRPATAWNRAGAALHHSHCGLSGLRPSFSPEGPCSDSDSARNL